MASLMLIYESGLTRGRFGWASVAGPVVRDWREQSRSFAAMGAFLPGSANLAGQGGAVRVAAARVEPDVFQALDVRPLYHYFVIFEAAGSA